MILDDSFAFQVVFFFFIFQLFFPHKLGDVKNLQGLCVRVHAVATTSPAAADVVNLGKRLGGFFGVEKWSKKWMKNDEEWTFHLELIKFEEKKR